MACRTHLPSALPLASALALLCGALPATAARRHGKPVRRGADRFTQATPLRSAQAAPSAPDCRAGGVKVACKVQYYGGPVLSNVKLYAVLWGPAVAAETRDTVADFLGALTNHEFMDGLAEYNTELDVQAGSSAGTAGTRQVVGRGTFAGRIAISPAVASGTISDDDIMVELDAQITAGHLPPPDADTLYVVFFPPAITVDDGTGSLSCVNWCGYHSGFRRSGSGVYYVVIPDHFTGDCASGRCGSDTDFHNLYATVAHEVAEAMTDAEVAFTATNQKPLAWYDVNAGEIGDMCTGQDVIAGPGGQVFGVQQIYSQRTGLCHTARTEAEDFKVLLPANTASLAAGATIAVPVTTATSAGSPQALALTFSGLPVGVTGTLDHSSVTSGAGAILTLKAVLGVAPVRDAVVAVVARGGGLAHSAALLLQVGIQAPAGNEFTIDLTTIGPLAGAGGVGARYTVATTAANGTAEAITLTAEGLPAGVTATFTPSKVTAGQPSELLLTAAAGTARSPSPVQFTVKGVTSSVSAGHTAVADVSVIGLPTAVLTAPAPGVVSGVVTLVADCATDPAVSLSKVELLDGSAVIASGTATTYTNRWDTSQVAVGAHTLAARATDSKGNTGLSTPVTVTVTPAPGGCAAASAGPWLLLGLLARARRRR